MSNNTDFPTLWQKRFSMQTKLKAEMFLGNSPRKLTLQMEDKGYSLIKRLLPPILAVLKQASTSDPTLDVTIHGNTTGLPFVPVTFSTSTVVWWSSINCTKFWIMFPDRLSWVSANAVGMYILSAKRKNVRTDIVVFKVPMCPVIFICH